MKWCKRGVVIAAIVRLRIRQGYLFRLLYADDIRRVAVVAFEVANPAYLMEWYGPGDVDVNFFAISMPIRWGPHGATLSEQNLWVDGSLGLDMFGRFDGSKLPDSQFKRLLSRAGDDNALSEKEREEADELLQRLPASKLVDAVVEFRSPLDEKGIKS